MTKLSLIERAAEIYDFRPRVPLAAVPDAAPAPHPRLVRGTVRPVARDRLAEAGFIVPDAPPDALAEEFRLVKRALLLGAVPLPRGRLILVASAQANEGKTFCAVNLALSLASERDTEVLLVDADVAKPEIVETLGLEGGPGLMDALADPALDVERLVIRTDIAKLSVLPAGTAARDDTELLASARTRAVIDGLAAAQPKRIVIFDTPPALAASPASVLALHVGQIVMVVRADRTGEAELRDALALLHGDAKVSLLLNGTTFLGGTRKFGSYYGQDAS